MMRASCKHTLIGIGLALAFLATPSAALARTFLISASPFPGQALARPPEEVRLIFNVDVDPESFTLVIVDAVGFHVDGDGHRGIVRSRLRDHEKPGWEGRRCAGGFCSEE